LRIGIRSELNGVLNLVYDLRGKYRLESHTPYSWEEISDRRLKNYFGDERGLEWFRTHRVLNWPKSVEEVYWRDFVDVRVPIYMESLIDIAAAARPIAEKYGISVDWDAYYSPLPAYLPSFAGKPDEFDLFGFYYRHTLHTNSFTMENPLLDEVSQRTPGTYEVIMNVDTARKKGIEDGDWIVMENERGRKVRAKVALREGIHPRCIAAAANSGHWSDGMPVAKGKGVFFNELLEIDLEHSDPVTLCLELTVPLKIWKAVGPLASQQQNVGKPVFEEVEVR
jgi:molybdopterin-containing oxidoreductase family molybdopterin binding subunit